MNTQQCEIRTVGGVTVATHLSDCRHFVRPVSITYGKVEAIAAAVCEFRDPQKDHPHPGTYCAFNREIVRLVLREIDVDIEDGL